MEQLYYLAVNGKQEGPFTYEELKAKRITKDTLVWTEGLNSWTKAAYVPMLKDILHSVPPPLNDPAQNSNNQIPPIPQQAPSQPKEISANYVLRERALEALNGKWGAAIGGCAIYLIILIILNCIPFVGFIVLLIITGPLNLGLAIFSLNIARNKPEKVDQIFEGFSDFERSTFAYLQMFLYIVLWTLLLIIPGIVAAIKYSMTFYIMADNKSIRPSDAIDQSIKLMDGYKWKYFGLILSFIGWGILCLLTLGIGFFLLVPYVRVSTAKFYDDLKENNPV